MDILHILEKMVIGMFMIAVYRDLKIQRLPLLMEKKVLLIYVYMMEIMKNY
jgi:hypothetical protein